MKKLLLMVAALGMLCSTGSAQIFGYGPKAGVVFSNVNNFPGATQRIGVVGGIFGDVMINNWLGFQTEFLYCMQGWHAKLTSQTVELNPSLNNPLIAAKLTELGEGEKGKLKVAMDYLKMPVLMKFYLVSGLNIQMGAQFNYLLSANLKFKDKNMGIKDMVNKFGVDFLTGVGYEFDFGLMLEGRYQIGLTSLQKNGNVIGSGVTNGALMVTAGWRF